MLAQDQDDWKARVSVPGEVRQVHKSGRLTRTRWRLAFVVLLGSSVFWVAQSHNGFERALSPPGTLDDARTWLEQTLSDLLKAGDGQRSPPAAYEALEKKKRFYEQIVGFGAEARTRLSIDAALQWAQKAVKAWMESALSWIDEGVRHAFLIHGAILGVLMMIGLGIRSGLLALLSRPIRQLDESIQNLGAGDLGKSIRITGPKKLRSLGDRLDWLRTRLLSREESRQQFLRNISTQFKTPLAGISESTDLLLAGAAGALNLGQRDLVARLSHDTQKLQRLLDESLRYSRIKENPIPQTKAAVNMKALLEAAIEAHQDAFLAKTLTVRQLLQPVEFLGIPDQLRAIVDNLLSNAIQFSQEGGTIRIILRDLKTGIQLEVEDDGPGIDAAERSRIFEPFFRGQAADLIDTKGTGLGLAIVSECVARHHGKVESIDPRQNEQGARIRVELPRVEVPSKNGSRRPCHRITSERDRLFVWRGLSWFGIPDRLT